MNRHWPHSAESAPEPRVELFDPSVQTWEEVRKDILEIDQLCFAEKAFSEEELRTHFEDAGSIVALLKKKDALIGFSYAIPDDGVENGIYVYTTDIRPEEQGNGYVVPLIEMIETEARRRGYSYLSRNAAIENGYADKIQKNYADRIVETYENASEFGPQRYFKITL